MDLTPLGLVGSANSVLPFTRGRDRVFGGLGKDRYEWMEGQSHLSSRAGMDGLMDAWHSSQTRCWGLDKGLVLLLVQAEEEEEATMLDADADAVLMWKDDLLNYLIYMYTRGGWTDRILALSQDEVKSSPFRTACLRAPA